MQTKTDQWESNAVYLFFEFFVADGRIGRFDEHLTQVRLGALGDFAQAAVVRRNVTPADHIESVVSGTLGESLFHLTSGLSFEKQNSRTVRASSRQVDVVQ